MNIQETLLLAAKAGVKFRLDGDHLGFRAPKGAMTKELRDEVMRHKSDLIAMLQRDRTEEPALPIPRATAPVAEGVPLSSGQERLWLIDRLAGASALYNLHFGLRW